MTVSLYTCGHCKLPQLVGQPCHCRTPEDEAFDELAKRQGAWGGGFTAKRKMAADKLWDKPSVAFDEWWNGDNDESTNPFRLESGAYWAWSGWKAALAQPAQEPVCDKDPQGCWNVRCQLGKQCKNLAQPVQPQQDESDLLTIAYQSGFYDGKKAALAQPAQEPPSEWAGIKAILDEYGLQAIDFVADFKAALAQPAQQEALYGMNQDDWKDVVAAISKVRDGRGIYLGCRPADVFQDWFLALGTAKVKEKNT